MRVVTALGGQKETPEGLIGKGDFLMTISSLLSRNYRVARRIVTEGIPKIKEEVKKRKITSEGLESIDAIHQMCQERQIKAPIVEQIYLVSKGKPPQKAVEDLIKLVQEKKGRK